MVFYNFENKANGMDVNEPIEMRNYPSQGNFPQIPLTMSKGVR